jgi:kinesin family protein 16B
MNALTAEWLGRWKEEGGVLREEGGLALRREGRGVVLDSQLPHLVGIDDNILSSGVVFYHLQVIHTCELPDACKPSLRQ